MEEIERLDALLGRKGSSSKDSAAPPSPAHVTLTDRPTDAVSLARHLYRSSHTQKSALSTLDDHLEWGDAAKIDKIDRTSSLHWEKNDGRLHPEYPLYCEGMMKPACRGILHMLCTMLLPIGLWHLLSEANGNEYGQVAGITYLLSNLWCYGASAVYHVGTWSPKMEIMLQKLDHSGIAVMSVGTFVPTIMLLFPRWEGILFILLSLGTCAWATAGIVHNNPSLSRQVLVPSVSLLFLPRIVLVFSGLELWCYVLTILLKTIGVFVFVRQKPDPWPSCFGYHEIWHVFVVAAGLCIYTANWSIIRRTCNPFAHEAPEDIVGALFNN
jgi:hemolysin III